MSLARSSSPIPGTAPTSRTPLRHRRAPSVHKKFVDPFKLRIASGQLTPPGVNCATGLRLGRKSG